MFLPMKPICPCGHIFKEVFLDNKIMNTKIICPECGMPFEGVIYQVPVDGVFEYNESKYNQPKDSDMAMLSVKVCPLCIHHGDNHLFCECCEHMDKFERGGLV